MSSSKSIPCDSISALVVSKNGVAPTMLLTCVSLRPSSNDTNSWTSFCFMAFITCATLALLFSVVCTCNNLAARACALGLPLLL